MRRRRDDDSFANSTQCDGSSQADLSQADASHADVSQTDSKADSMRTRPARKRRRTAATDAAVAMESAAVAVHQPLQNLQLLRSNSDANSLAAGAATGDDEQSLTSDSGDEQLQVEAPRANEPAVSLELVYRNGQQQQPSPQQLMQIQTQHFSQFVQQQQQPTHFLQQQQQQQQQQQLQQQSNHTLSSFKPPSIAAALSNGSSRISLQAIPPFANGHFAAQDDSVIVTSYSRPTYTEEVLQRRPRSNSLPNEFDDDNAMDTT